MSKLFFCTLLAFATPSTAIQLFTFKKDDEARNASFVRGTLNSVADHTQEEEEDEQYASDAKGVFVCNQAPTNKPPYRDLTKQPLSTESSKGTGSELSFCESLCFLKWTGKCSAGGYVRPGCLGMYTNAKHGNTRYVRCAEQSQSKKCHPEVKPKGPTSGSCPTDVDLSPDGPFCSNAKNRPQRDVDSSTTKATKEQFADAGPESCPIRADNWRGKFTECLAKPETCGCVDKWNQCAYEAEKKCPSGDPAKYSEEDKWWVEHCSLTCKLCTPDTPPTPTEPPVPTPRPTSEPAPEIASCKSWCAKNSKKWAKKCKWAAKCDGCQECMGPTEESTEPPTEAPTEALTEATTEPPTETEPVTPKVNDPSKCLENGNFDDDCCALKEQASCADGYNMETGVLCAKWRRTRYYTTLCYPP